MRRNRDCLTRMLMAAAFLACILLPVSGTAAEPSVNDQPLPAKDGDIEARDKKSKAAALMSAAWVKNFNVVKSLINNGADENAKDERGRTILMAAGWAGNFEVARLLLDKGADVNAKDESGETVLMKAAWGENLEVVKLLIEKGADVHAKDKSGQTALAHAAWTGQLEFVRLLTEKGLDVNAHDACDRTALMKDAEGTWPEVVKFLIDKGANANAKDYVGDTALMKAVNWGLLFRLWTEMGGPKEYFKDRFGRTPKERCLEVAKLLIDNGADVNAEDEYGRTALSHVSARKQPKIVQYLNARGAKSSKRKSKTP